MSVSFARPLPRVSCDCDHAPLARMSLLRLAEELDYARQVETYWAAVTQPKAPQKPPLRAKPGRRKGTFDLPNHEIFWQMYDARRRWFAKHPHATEITQPELLEEMGKHPETDTRRVREWCTRLQISWQLFKCRD
jgi:hypothetical protein